ncbi:MAG TPA: sensor domain-containing phosphodiesterase [Nocardioidaceae bacterium]|nr:sensor domain-containing phosphodiesterase [Nocardioidaceae bacterium]
MGRLRRRVDLAEAVAELSQRALRADEPDALLRESLQVAVELTGADYGTAVRRLPDGRLRVAHELGPQPLPPGTILQPHRERSYLLRVVSTGQPFLSSDLANDPHVSPPEPLLSRGVVSGIAVPVRGAHEVSGVLGLHFHRRRRFGRHDVAAASALASVVATAWQQVEQRERLAHLALHDPLTELPNRVLFLDRLEQALAQQVAGPQNGPGGLAVMLIDLDDFKGVNDGLGHAAGDHLLRVAAQRLQAAVRPEDTVARLGGDEFGVLCHPVPDEATALRLARRMLVAVRRPVEVEGSSLTVSASFGLTSRAGTGTAPPTAGTLLGEADIALYRAKDRGRGQVQLYDERLQRSTRRRRQLESELQAALERGELRLHYQPVRRTRDLQTVGVEALLRWQHPTRGLLLPDDFVPTAEQTGLLVPIGTWVLNTACRQVSQWQARSLRGADPLWLSVNVSPRQLDDTRLPDAVAAALRETSLSEGSLVLELTETALMPGDATRREALLRLRNSGAQLFLDDFGTGFSSLTHLTELPVQAVKVDKSFVAGLPTNRRSAAVVSSLMTLSDELGLAVIAEGVETYEQLDALQEMHCQSVQGFLLDHPQALPHLETRSRTAQLREPRRLPL